MLAHILVIGDEILIGQVQDTNSNWMATQLNLQGVQVHQINAIADTKEAIEEAVRRALSGPAQLILMTGGLGPTKDDITKNTLAQLFGMELEFHEESWQNLVELFQKFHRTAGNEYRWQCNMPVGATILRNKRGTAPGMWFEQDGKVIVSMPGVPSEMKYLMEHEVLPRLRTGHALSPIKHRTILTVGIGETQLMGIIGDWEDALPDHTKLAYLPSLGSVRLRLTARGDNEAELEQILENETTKVVALLDKHVYGFEDQTLESVIGDILRSKKATLSLAESCTGGHIAHKITSIPGCSEYYLGSVVAYSYALKESLLGVKRETLEQYGAVSEQTVKEMALGTLKLTGADYALATSGIAGPDGGTPEKPVGMVCMAVAGPGGEVVSKTFHMGRDRIHNIQLATTVGLNFVRKFLLAQEMA